MMINRVKRLTAWARTRQRCVLAYADVLTLIPERSDSFSPENSADCRSSDLGLALFPVFTLSPGF